MIVAWIGAALLGVAGLAVGGLVMVLARLVVPLPSLGVEGRLQGPEVARVAGKPVVYGVFEVSAYRTTSTNDRSLELLWRTAVGEPVVELDGKTVTLGDPFVDWRLRRPSVERVEVSAPFPQAALPSPRVPRPSEPVQVRALLVFIGDELLVESGGRVWIGGREVAEAHVMKTNAKRVRAIQLGARVAAGLLLSSLGLAVLGAML